MDSQRPRPERPCRFAALLAAGLLLAACGVAAAAASGLGEPPADRVQAESPILLKIAGGLGGVAQHTRHEAPFWQNRVPLLTQGRVHAEIAPFDGSGIRGQEMLSLMRLGVVPFGTILLALAAGIEPELNAVDLPLLNPDVATLRQSARLWQPHIANLLRERYDVELLAIYTYPAQVIFCREPFARLDDLRGRRVRSSSVGQSEFLAALGAVPVVTPFSEIMAAMRAGVVSCAVTGSLSGNSLGLHTMTSHVGRQAISWGVSAFGANRQAWFALPATVREQLQAGLVALQDEIWQAAQMETEDGFACNTGRPECSQGKPGQMVMVEDNAADRLRRDQMLRDVVLPGWVGRCGDECAEAWNLFIAPTRGLLARAQ